MPRPERLLERGGWYYLRAKVPVDLLPHYNGKREIKRSLRTKDFKEAVRLVRIHSAEIDAAFSEQRERHKPTTLKKLTDADVKFLARTWFGELRSTLEGSQQLAISDEGDRKRLMALQEDEGNLLNIGMNGESPEGLAWADALLQRFGYQRDPTSKEHAFLRTLCERAMLALNRHEQDRLQADFTERTHDTLLASSTGLPAVNMRELVSRYEDELRRRNIRARTREEAALVFGALVELLGADKPIASVSRQDCRRVQAILDKLPANASKRFPKTPLERVAELASAQKLPPMKPVTARKYLTHLSALFEFAVREDLLGKNPAKGLRPLQPDDPKHEKRKPFSLEQLKSIFDAPLYRGCLNDEAGYAIPGRNHPRRARFWLPLIALWTGMRENEICQLHVADIEKRDGVDVIVVRESETDPSKRLKTKGSARVIPIHPELGRIGFLEYATGVREKGETRLFPDLQVGAKGYYSDPVQKWFGRFLVRCEAKTSRTSFHSFRHNFRDAMREAGVSAEVVRALGGWVGPATTSDAYGSGLRPSTLLREISKIRYPGLDLTHLYEQGAEISNRVRHKRRRKRQ